MKTSRKLIYIMAIVLTAVLSVGCSKTDGKDPNDPGFEKGIPTEVTFTLSSRSGNYTRADGKPQNPTENVEFIHNWWIAFVDQSGNVTVEERSEDSSIGFEQETFKIIIPSGTYDIYAFANIDVPEDPEDKVSNLLDDTNKLFEKTLNEFVADSKFDQEGMQWPSDKNIPMTGFLENVKIRNTIEEAFSIEVIRAVAKVEFSINNPSDDEITLKDLTFDQITKSGVSLLPDFDAIGQKAYTPLSGATYGTLDLSTYLKTPDGLNVVLTNGEHTFSYYSKESIGKKYDGQEVESFKITLKVDRKKSGTGDAKTEETRDFYTTSKIKNYINRNDWIRIPIEFSDWKIFWKLRAYPPIGGYPPVFDQNDDGSTLTARVATGGEFELYPYLITKGGVDWTNKIDWSPKNEDGTEDESRKVKAEVIEDTNGIFMKDSNGKKLLSVDAANKSIVGELDPKKTGRAKVKIDFYLEASTNITEVRTCTFTINRN